MTTFYILILSWLANGAPYSKLEVFGSINACQAAGLTQSSNVAWRCQLETVRVEGNNVTVNVQL